MAESETRPSPAPPPFEMTLSGDRRFHRIVGELYARAAEQVGYGAADAVEIGRSVERAVLGVMEIGFPEHAREQIDIRFAVNEQAMDVYVRYQAGPGEPAPVPAVEVKRALAEVHDGEAPLDVIRRAMPEIEFGRDDDGEYCRLSRKLPGTA